MSYLVDVGEGRAWKWHLDHLKGRDLPEPENAELAPRESDEIDSPSPLGDVTVPPATAPTEHATVEPSVVPPISSTGPSLAEPSATSPIYPSRDRHPPDRFDGV